MKVGKRMAGQSAQGGDDGQKRAFEKRALTVSRPSLLRNGSDEAFRIMVHDMLGFAARIQEVRSRLGALISLSGSQYTILIALAQLEGPEGVGVNTIADHLHLSGAFVTIEVNKLVALGFVKKETNPEDRRRVLLTITPFARARLNELTRVQQPANDALFGELSDEDFDMFRRILPVLVDSADRSLRLIEFMAPDGVMPAHGSEG